MPRSQRFSTKTQLLATTRRLDWWKILEEVERDVTIAKENIMGPKMIRWWIRT